MPMRTPVTRKRVPLRQRLLKDGALIAGLTVLLSFVFSPDRIILFPTREPLGSIGATRQTIPFQNGELEIWTGRSRGLAAGAAPGMYLLRFYGNADRADPNVGIEADEWTSTRSVEIWGMNYPGYGGSTGEAKLRSIAPAALAAYDALKQKAGDIPIIVFGTSIGTTAALHVSAHRPVAGVIVQNPPPLRQMALRQFGWWNLWLLAGPLALRIPASIDNVANARASHSPGTFVLAGSDRIIAPKYHRLVVDAYAGEKRIITMASADHNDPLDAAAVTELNAAIEWMLSRPVAVR